MDKPDNTHTHTAAAPVIEPVLDTIERQHKLLLNRVTELETKLNNLGRAFVKYVHDMNVLIQQSSEQHVVDPGNGTGPRNRIIRP